MAAYSTDHIDHYLINDMHGVNIQHEDHDVPLLTDVSAKYVYFFFNLFNKVYTANKAIY